MLKPETQHYLKHLQLIRDHIMKGGSLGKTLNMNVNKTNLSCRSHRYTFGSTGCKCSNPNR